MTTQTTELYTVTSGALSEVVGATGPLAAIRAALTRPGSPAPGPVIRVEGPGGVRHYETGPALRKLGLLDPLRGEPVDHVPGESETVRESETDFGARLRLLRDQAGLSVQQLARKAGLHRNHLQMVVSGKRKDPAWSTVVRLADALGVSTEAFRASSREEAPAIPK